MSLFNFGKTKKAESKPISESTNKTDISVKSIKVLGTGCKFCHQMYENAQKATADLNITPEYITDIEQITRYAVMTMPALVVDEKVVSSGKVLKPDEIRALIENN